MIVRILNEGQWQVGDHLIEELNTLDDAVEKAVQAGDQDALAVALDTLLDKVRSEGTALQDAELHDSDLILPAADSTVADVQSMLSESEEGLIPG
jgi:hypothetical protein